MAVLLYTHPACLAHDNGPGHPERPARIDAAAEGVRASGLEYLERPAPIAELEALYPIHEPEYVELIREVSAAGGRHMDADTPVSAGTWEAALRAAGAGIDAVDALRRGDADCAFLAVRPPGHHAGPHDARGFCIFNNVAIATAHVTAAGERVVIVDWDVHHGDGTQESFYGAGDVLYLSIHQFPFYPGSGWIDESGSGAGRGTTVNVAAPAHTAGDVVAEAVEGIFAPILDEFAPDWVLISAGYDGHRVDPLADLRFESSDYGWMARRLASSHSGRVVVFLEGGYDLGAIAESSAATVRGVAGEDFDRPSGDSPRASWQMLSLARDEAARHWSVVQGG